MLRAKSRFIPTKSEVSEINKKIRDFPSTAVVFKQLIYSIINPTKLQHS